MKRSFWFGLLVAGAMIIVLGTAIAAPPEQTVLVGAAVPGPTKDVYVDNVARTIQSLYERGGGTWLRGADTPRSMLFSCATTAIRMGFGGSTPTVSTLHVFPANSSWDRKGKFWMSTGIFIAGGATDNVACAMTPEY